MLYRRDLIITRLVVFVLTMIISCLIITTNLDKGMYSEEKFAINNLTMNKLTIDNHELVVYNNFIKLDPPNFNSQVAAELTPDLPSSDQSTSWKICNVVKYTTDRVNIRYSPSLDSDVYKVSDIGSSYEIIEENGEWSKLLLEGDEYYISSKYLTELSNKQLNEIDNLANIIWAESGNQSKEGQYAVGTVVMNRVDSKYYPDSIIDVITQKSQFSGYKSEQWHIGYNDSTYEIAKKVYLGYRNLPKNVLGFKTLDCKVEWSDFSYYTTIGNHNFYTKNQ